MALVLTQIGANALWGWMLGYGTPGPFRCHLLGSAFTPLHTSTEPEFEAHELPLSAGYAPKSMPIAGPAWDLANIPAGQKATYTILNWTFTGPLTVLGYWISTSSDAVAIWGDLFEPAYVFSAGGGPFSLVLSPTLISAP